MTQTRPHNLVIGCDASTRNIGWAVIDHKHETRVASGVIVLKEDDFYDRLRTGPLRVASAISEHVDISEAKMFVIEHSFSAVNKNTGEMITMMIGAVCCVIRHKGICPIERYSPTTIKAVFAGHGHADKDDIREHVAMEFGVNIKSEDECDALAAALAYTIEDKTGVLKKKREDKKWKKKQKAKKAAKTRAAKTGKSLEGELPL